MAIITVSRQMGTGAYQIATEVAKKLKYTFVDGELLSSCAPKYGLALEMLHVIDEKPPSFNTVEDRKRAAALHTLELMLLDFARKGNVVLYGRGCQYLLKECGNVLRLRIIADFEDRAGRFAEREWIDPDLARSITRLNDSQRESFIHFCFSCSWDDPLGYDLVFNTTHLSPETVVESAVVAARDPYLKEAEAGATERIDNAILTNRIKIALLNADELDYHPFRITAQNGHIHLSGYLSSVEEKNNIVRMVKSVKGVKDVEEEIRIVNCDLYKDKS